MRHLLSLGLVLVLGTLALPLPAAAQTFNPAPINVSLPDLTVNLSASSPTVGGGEQVVYTLGVQNVGQVAFRPIGGSPVYFAAPARAITALLSLPTGSTFKSVTAASGFQCAYVAPVVTCTGGSLDAATSASIVVTTLAPLSAGSFTSTATVDATNALVERSETNNSVSAGVNVPQSDLTVSIAASKSSVDDQGTVNYFVYVDNAAPAAQASGVTVRYTLPAGASLWSWRDGESSWLTGVVHQAGFTCSASGTLVTCSGGTIGSGARGTITLTVIMPRTHGVVSGSVVVEPGHKTASIDTTVVGRVDLSVDVTHAIIPTFQRTVTVRNLGAGPATGVTVKIESTKWEYFDDGGPDLYVGVLADSGFTCTRATYVAGSYLNYHTGDVITCTGGTIAAGGRATLSVWHLLTTTDDSRNTDVEVDPSNAIRESFENNNQATATTRI